MSGKQACAAVLLLCAAAGGASARAAGSDVGFATFEFPVKDPAAKSKHIDVAIWYPTADEPAVHTYYTGGPKGKVAKDGNPDSEGGPYPLVVYSHGYGGGAFASIYLSEYLAKHGLVVAACDHSDKHQTTRIRGKTSVDTRDYLLSARDLARSGQAFDRSGFAYRLRELTAVIDGVLAESSDSSSRLHGIIDPERIGACGHSLGSYTALTVSGMGKRDKRIKALLALSGGVFMFAPGEYKGLEVPVMFMYGEREGTEWRTRNINDQRRATQIAFDNCKAPKFLLEVKGANHFAFCQAVFSPRPLGAGNVAQAQAAVIKKYALAFFTRYLKGDEAADSVLTRRDSMLTDLRYQSE